MLAVVVDQHLAAAQQGLVVLGAAAQVLLAQVTEQMERMDWVVVAVLVEVLHQREVQAATAAQA
jgi:ribose 1,5-bisphosphokinase PhnN